MEETRIEKLEPDGPKSHNCNTWGTKNTIKFFFYFLFPVQIFENIKQTKNKTTVLQLKVKIRNETKNKWAFIAKYIVDCMFSLFFHYSSYHLTQGRTKGGKEAQIFIYIVMLYRPPNQRRPNCINKRIIALSE